MSKRKRDFTPTSAKRLRINEPAEIVPPIQNPAPAPSPPPLVRIRRRLIIPEQDVARIVEMVRQEVEREIGKCYCGAGQITFINRGPRDDNDPLPPAFTVCAKTKKSMELCRRMLP